MNVLIICTSQNKNGSTKKVSNFLLEVFKKSGVNNCEIVDFEKFDLPSVAKEVLEPSNLSGFQSRLVSEWEKASLVVIASPEYNWSVNGEVLTMLEQFGSKKFKALFDQKVFAMVGVSSGRGGRLPALEIVKVTNKLISFLGVFSVVSPKILEAHEVPLNLDQFGRSMGNTLFDREVRSFVDYSIRVAEKWLVGETKF